MALAPFRAIRGNPCRARAQADSTFVQFNIVKLFCAILHGGDRDTLDAMAYTVSGAILAWKPSRRPGERSWRIASILLRI